MYKMNTMDKIEYIVETSFWVVISIVLYRGVLCNSIPGCTLLVSKMIMCGLVIVFVTFGIFLTISNSRNEISVFVNVLLPYQLYIIIVFGKEMSAFSSIVVWTSLLLFVIYFILSLTPQNQNIVRGKKVSQRSKRYEFLCLRTVLGVGILILTIAINACYLFGEPMALKTTTAKVPSSVGECTIANSIDAVNDLQQEEWSGLSLRKKVDILQNVANIEACYLGLPHELNITTDILQEAVIAQYEEKTHTITVSISYLDSVSAEKTLDAICHESYHAYQYRLCDVYKNIEPEYQNLMIFESVPFYLEEFQNYKGEIGDNLSYYFQKCEVEARNYAADRVEDYYDKMELDLK